MGLFSFLQKRQRLSFPESTVSTDYITRGIAARAEIMKLAEQCPLVIWTLQFFISLKSWNIFKIKDCAPTVLHCYKCAFLFFCLTRRNGDVILHIVKKLKYLGA